MCEASQDPRFSSPSRSKPAPSQPRLVKPKDLPFFGDHLFRVDGDVEHSGMNDVWVQRAWSSYLDADFSAAEDQCLACLQEDEDSGYAWELLGLIYHDRGEFLRATDALERASLLIRVRIEARIALAAAYGALQRKQLACELYLELVFGQQLDPGRMLHIAAGLEAIDEPRLAMEVCRRAERQVEQIADDGCVEAQIHYDMGFYAARAGFPPHISEALTRRAVELEPGNVHFRAGLVSLLIRLDRFEEAFDAVAALTAEKIREINCVCCLERIGNLLRSFGASERAMLCRQQLARLQDLREPSADAATREQRSGGGQQ